MGIFEQWRQAAHLIRQTLQPTRTPSPSQEQFGAERPLADPLDSNGAARNLAGTFYKTKVRRAEERRDQAIVRRTWSIQFAVASVIIIGVVVYLSVETHRMPLWPAGFPLATGIIALIEAHRCNRRLQDCVRLIAFYRNRLQRVQHQWMGQGDPGSDLEMASHLSAADLDLFGEGSLFELLSDIQTPAGRETLARWLQEPALPEEVRARQESVRHLRDRVALRERVALLREGDPKDYSWTALRAWFTADPVKFPLWAVWGALFLSLSMVAMGAGWAGGLLIGRDAVRIMVGIAAAEAGLALWLRGRVERVLGGLRLSSRKVEAMRRLCALVEEERFETPLLVELRRRLCGSSRRLAQLQRLLLRLETRKNEWLFYLCLLLMWGTQWTIRIERWRQLYGNELLDHLGILGEFEALMAMAAYSYENSDDPYPEFAEAAPLFEAAALGHPLLDPAVCVRNDLRLNQETRFLMVTGSNMSGKSTLLRAVGLNATLAWMGAPVRAKSLRVSRLQVCASIRVEDSLLHGLSHFYAEVQRLRAMLDTAVSRPPVLFLIDELFAGTNSADRRVAAEAVIRLLVERRAIGLVTSHDLALTEIAEQRALAGANVHFADSPTATGLSFDYLLRPGKLNRGNALKIIQMVGIPLKPLRHE